MPGRCKRMQILARDSRGQHKHQTSRRLSYRDQQCDDSEWNPGASAAGTMPAGSRVLDDPVTREDVSGPVKRLNITLKVSMKLFRQAVVVQVRRGMRPAACIIGIPEQYLLASKPAKP